MAGHIHSDLGAGFMSVFILYKFMILLIICILSKCLFTVNLKKKNTELDELAEIKG